MDCFGRKKTPSYKQRNTVNINSIRDKKLDLMVFLEVHQPHVVAIQETKIDSSVATSELFPETCQYNIFRKERNLYGSGVMLLIHKNTPHTPLNELENNSESVWAKYLQIKLLGGSCFCTKSEVLTQ